MDNGVVFCNHCAASGDMSLGKVGNFLSAAWLVWSRSKPAGTRLALILAQWAPPKVTAAQRFLYSWQCPAKLDLHSQTAALEQ